VRKKNKNDNDVIAQIYDTALAPGDWVDLLDTLAEWAGHGEATPDSEEESPAGDNPGRPAVTRAVVGNSSVRPEVEHLIEHLERAVKSSAYMHALEDRCQVLNTLYNQMPWPMLMLDEWMQVVECNAIAHQVLAEGVVQLTSSGQLVIHDRKLRQALVQVNKLAEGRNTQLLSAPEESVSLLCVPVQKSDAPGNISQVRTILWVLSGHSIVTPSAERLQSLFAISPAEARLLHVLCKVGNLNQSAALLDISVHTARTQLKSTMAKLEANSQVQLVSRVMGHALVQGANLPAEQTEQEYTVTLPDGRVLSWMEYGAPDGAPVLTLDNLGSSLPDHAWFDRWYREQNLRVILIVRPGYGISTYNPDLQFGNLGADIRFLCQHLGIERPPMASYCGGGPYALCAAAQDPELFSRLGILASTVPIEHFELDKLDRLHKMLLRVFRRDPRLFLLIGRLAIRGVQKAPERFYVRMAKNLCLADQKIFADEELLSRTIKRMRHSQFQGARVHLEEYLRMQEPWQVDLGTISIPVLQWHGEDDRIISIGSARGLASSIPNVRFRSFPGYGRFMVYTHWQDFLVELLELPATAAPTYKASG